MKTWLRSYGILGLALAQMSVLAPGAVAQNELNHSPAATPKAALTVTSAPAASVPGLAVAAVPPINASNAAAAVPGAVVSGDQRQPSKTELSPWTTQIVKLAQAGIEDGIMLSFIDNTPGTFNLGADQVIHLKKLGVSSPIIAAMIDHDVEVASGQRPVTASTVPAARPAFQITFVSGSDAQGRGDKPSATVPAVSPGMNGGWADDSMGTFVSEMGYDTAPPESSVADYTTADEIASPGPAALSPPRQRTETGELYPVREPYPVELTAPILVIRAWGRTPNTLVIQLSP